MSKKRKNRCSTLYLEGIARFGQVTSNPLGKPRYHLFYKNETLTLRWYDRSFRKRRYLTIPNVPQDVAYHVYRLLARDRAFTYSPEFSSFPKPRLASIWEYDNVLARLFIYKIQCQLYLKDDGVLLVEIEDDQRALARTTLCVTTMGRGMPYKYKTNLKPETAMAVGMRLIQQQERVGLLLVKSRIVSQLPYDSAEAQDVISNLLHDDWGAPQGKKS